MSGSVFDQGWEGKYSDQRSEFSKIHPKFREGLYRNKVSEQDFYKELKNCRRNYERIKTVLKILSLDSLKGMTTSRQIESKFLL
jgi:hypothetical protein